MLDLADVSFVKRIRIGSSNPVDRPTEQSNQEAVSLLNRSLTGTPRGRIIGIEKEFSLSTVGDDQVISQALVYHVGWTRKPLWLDE